MFGERKVAAMWGVLLGVIAALIVVDFPVHTPPGKARRRTTEAMRALLGRPVAVKEVEVRRVGEGIETWKVRGLTLLAFKGGRILVPASYYLRKAGEGYVKVSLHDTRHRPPAAGTFRPGKILLREDEKVLEGKRGRVVVFDSPRCGACALLEGAVFRAAREAGAALYVKELVAPEDAAAREFVRWSRAAGPDEWLRVRRLGRLVLGGGGNAGDVGKVMSLVLGRERTPSLPLGWVERTLREADEAGVSWTPTIVVNGRLVRNAAPAELFKKISLILEGRDENLRESEKAGRDSPAGGQERQGPPPQP